MPWTPTKATAYGSMNRLQNKSRISEQEIASAEPRWILAHMLSTKSYIPTTLSGNDVAQDVTQCSEEIGKGQCGTVYALAGTTMVARIPNSREKVSQMVAEVEAHKAVLEALAKVDVSLQAAINVPAFHKWIDPRHSPEFWASYGVGFRKSVDTEQWALLSDRVYPVPLQVREALVDSLCPKAIQRRKQEFLDRPENNNCLIRLYLGRREAARVETKTGSLTLRNFPLHVNEVEDLGLDTSFFAGIMAQTLALLHWKAGIDGNDVEFILGSSPVKAPTLDGMADNGRWAVGERFRSDVGGQSTSVWLIDFNQCSTFEKDEPGLKKLVDAFVWNDPYYPRPSLSNTKENELWGLFRARYLEVSYSLTKSAMPARLISNIEEQFCKGTVEDE